MIPKSNNWNETEPISGFTNCGKKAMKNRAVFGFVSSIKILSKNILGSGL